MKVGDIVLAVRYSDCAFDESLNHVIIGKISYITDDELFATVKTNDDDYPCWFDELVLLKGV